MKHFRLIGPATTREFDIEDDEMLVQKVIKIDDYEHGIPMMQCKPYEEKNIKVYDTKRIGLD